VISFFGRLWSAFGLLWPQSRREHRAPKGIIPICLRQGFRHRPAGDDGPVGAAGKIKKYFFKNPLNRAEWALIAFNGLGKP